MVAVASEFQHRALPKTHTIFERLYGGSLAGPCTSNNLFDQIRIRVRVRVYSPYRNDRPSQNSFRLPIMQSLSARF